METKIKDVKVIFITGIYPKEIENEVRAKSKSGLQDAANNLQWEFIKGLSTHMKNNMSIVNSMYIGSYPMRYSDLYVPQFNFAIDNIDSAINTSFINIPFIKPYSKFISIKRVINRLINDESCTYVLIGYAMTLHITKILKEYSSRKRIVTILIVPDLPEYMNFTKKKWLWMYVKNRSNNKNYENARFIDGFILLTKHMLDRSVFSAKPNIVIEGIASSDLQYHKENNIKDNDDIFIITYTGGLNEQYGVKDLVENFLTIDNEKMQLVICGVGELSNYIMHEAKNDHRIKFMGHLPKSEIIKIQSRSSILVNPRKNTSVFTKYSFPSKVIEYMASGVPVLMYKLDGIPDEYYGNVLLIDDYKSISDAINGAYLLGTSKLRDIGNQGRNFILKEKNSNIQTERLISLISTLKESKEK